MLQSGVSVSSNICLARFTEVKYASEQFLSKRNLVEKIAFRSLSLQKLLQFLLYSQKVDKDANDYEAKEVTVPFLSSCWTLMPNIQQRIDLSCSGWERFISEVWRHHGRVSYLRRVRRSGVGSPPSTAEHSDGSCQTQFFRTHPLCHSWEKVIFRKKQIPICGGQTKKNYLINCHFFLHNFWILSTIQGIRWSRSSS